MRFWQFLSDPSAKWAEFHMGIWTPNLKEKKSLNICICCSCCLFPNKTWNRKSCNYGKSHTFFHMQCKKCISTSESYLWEYENSNNNHHVSISVYILNPDYKRTLCDCQKAYRLKNMLIHQDLYKLWEFLNQEKLVRFQSSSF